MIWLKSDETFPLFAPKTTIWIRILSTFALITTIVTSPTLDATASEEGVYMLVPGCVSCDIVAGKRVEPGGVIYENDYWHIGSMGGLPVVWRGFLSIKLKRHCEHLAELSLEEALALGPVIQSTCLALTEVLKPAKVYVCSFGDGVKHVHLWVLPRSSDMRPGMHSVIFNLDMRTMLTRLLGIKKWIVRDDEVAGIAKQVRECLCRQQNHD